MTIVTTAGVPIPAPKANVRAVQGAAIGGASLAAAAGLLALGPFGIVALAALGAGVGAAIGNAADEQGK